MSRHFGNQSLELFHVICRHCGERGLKLESDEMSLTVDSYRFVPVAVEYDIGNKHCMAKLGLRIGAFKIKYLRNPLEWCFMPKFYLAAACNSHFKIWYALLATVITRCVYLTMCCFLRVTVVLFSKFARIRRQIESIDLECDIQSVVEGNGVKHDVSVYNRWVLIEFYCYDMHISRSFVFSSFVQILWWFDSKYSDWAVLNPPVYSFIFNFLIHTLNFMACNLSCFILFMLTCNAILVLKFHLVYILCRLRFLLHQLF